MVYVKTNVKANCPYCGEEVFTEVELREKKKGYFVACKKYYPTDEYNIRIPGTPQRGCDKVFAIRVDWQPLVQSIKMDPADL
jgi:hypothetical protein